MKILHTPYMTLEMGNMRQRQPLESIVSKDRREERERQGRENANNWRNERGYELLPDARKVAFVDHLMAGVDLNTVRELLGHSDIKMTLRYAHLAPEHKAAAVQKLIRTI
jgi:site-specific recombinase XerC